MFYYNDGANNNKTAMADDNNGEMQTDYSTPNYLLMGQAVAMYNWDIDSLGSYLRVTADYLRRKNHQKQTIAQLADGQETRVGQASTRQVSDMLRVRPTWNKVFVVTDGCRQGLISGTSTTTTGAIMLLRVSMS